MKSAKKKFRFYILTTAADRFSEYESSAAKHNVNFHALQNLFLPRWSNLRYDEAVVVVNTFDIDYQNLVVEWCKSKGIECHVTECFGSPGKGKNELLKVFLDSDDDYCVQIDGDDVLTPYGVQVYRNLVNDNPPDSIVIYHQWSQTVNPFGQRMFHRIMDNPDAPANDVKNRKMIRINIEYHLQSNYRGYAKGIKRLGGVDAAVDTFAKYTNDVHEFSRQYNETYLDADRNKFMVDGHCRLVWYSKKAAKYRFDEEMMIGEDTRHYLHLKTLHYKGELDMKRLKEIPCTYVYNNINGGMVAKASVNMSFLEWMRVYLEKTAVDVEKGLIGKYPNLPEYHPPLFEDIDDYGVTTRFNIDDVDIDSITDEKVKELYSNIKECDRIRIEAKEKIKQRRETALKDLRWLVESLGKDIRNAYVYPPYKNILACHPAGREHYYLNRIFE